MQILAMVIRRENNEFIVLSVGSEPEVYNSVTCMLSNYDISKIELDELSENVDVFYDIEDNIVYSSIHLGNSQYDILYSNNSDKVGNINTLKEKFLEPKRREKSEVGNMIDVKNK